MEHSMIMVKPEGVRRRLVGQIIQRLEAKGLTLTALKMLTPTKAILDQHYAEHVNKPFYPEYSSYFMQGKVVAMIVSGKGAVAVCRRLIGATDPLQAEMGTIRGDYGIAKGRNLVHGSDSVESAVREIQIWFGSDYEYVRACDEDLITDQ